jgi:hypothetical protein
MSAPTIPSMPKKRGRPRKYVKVEVGKDGKPVEEQIAVKPLSDSELLELVKSRFAVMSRQMHAVVAGKRRSLIISGAPGVGKTYTIEEILAKAKEDGKTRYHLVHGTMTAINLYRMLFRYKNANDVLVLDDSDSVFTDETAMNILKAAVDTSKTRILSYFSDSFSGAELGGEEGESGDIPQEFIYEGSIVFITNLDFDAYIAAGSTKYTKHMEALMSRSLYLDLRIHGRRELALWIGHVLRSAKVLQVDYNLSEKSVAEILTYLIKHQNRVRALSIRSALHCASLIQTEPETWRESADVLLLKGEGVK